MTDSNRARPTGFDPARETNEALRWLDLHFQHRGQFAGAAKVQRRTPEMVGVAILMARYKANEGAHQTANSQQGNHQ